MKVRLSLVLFIVSALATVNSFAQQEITLTATVGNTTSSKSTIDLPALNGNPNAIIVATQIGTLNPNPIGAWYYNNIWNIFNITHANMPLGAKFKVQYFVQPDANHFLHIITTGSLATVPRSYLDYPVLNNQPNAQFKIFQNHSSVYTRNPSEAKAEYEAGSGKWFIENVNGTALSRDTAYNIVIASGALGLNPNTTTPVGEATPKNPIPISPTSTTPTGNAGGDLSGSYPNPKVVGLNGNPLLNKSPSVGDTLRWNGTAWEPVTIISGDTARYNAGAGLSLNGTTFSAQNTAPMWNANQIVGGKISTTPPTTGQVLKWNGTEWASAKDEVAPTSTAPPTATPPVAPMQIFFKVDALVPRPQLYDLDESHPEGNHFALSHSIVLVKKSRLVINLVIHINGSNCVAFCPTAEGDLIVKINNIIPPHSVTHFAVGNQSSASQNISNYVIDFDPGTYKIDFFVKHNPGSPGFSSLGQYSSVMVIPLE